MRRATPCYPGGIPRQHVISIHALLAESDQPPGVCVRGRKQGFLSTLSLRRATGAVAGGIASFFDFYPRSPCGERPDIKANFCLMVYISIHALLAESDRKSRRNLSSWCHISIHALLAESDATPIKTIRINTYFYPRSPCGERLLARCSLML